MPPTLGPLLPYLVIVYFLAVSPSDRDRAEAVLGAEATSVGPSRGQALVRCGWAVPDTMTQLVSVCKAQAELNRVQEKTSLAVVPILPPFHLPPPAWRGWYPDAREMGRGKSDSALTITMFGPQVGDEKEGALD